MTFLLSRDIFPIILSSLSTFRHFPFYDYYFFLALSSPQIPDATSLRALPAAQSLKHNRRKALIKHPRGCDFIELQPLLDLPPPPPPPGIPSSFTSPCNSLLCPSSSLWPLWTVQACQACVKSSLWPSGICFFSRFCLFCSHRPGWQREKCP